MYYEITDQNQLRYVKKAKSYCTDILNKLKMSIISNYGIKTNIHLIGSVRKNLITKNGKKPIDFDFNIEIEDFGDYDDDDELLKRTIRLALNEVIKKDKTPGLKGAGDVRDSTSVLTSRPLYFSDAPSLKFSFDVGIVYEDNRGVCRRLIHNKTKETYEWKILPDMDEVYEKYDEINSVNGGHEDVVQKYIDAKNRYLKRGDTTHPSYICFVEAVNNVHNEYVLKGRLRTVS